LPRSLPSLHATRAPHQHAITDSQISVRALVFPHVTFDPVAGEETVHDAEASGLPIVTTSPGFGVEIATLEERRAKARKEERERERDEDRKEREEERKKEREDAKVEREKERKKERDDADTKLEAALAKEKEEREKERKKERDDADTKLKKERDDADTKLEAALAKEKKERELLNTKINVALLPPKRPVVAFLTSFHPQELTTQVTKSDGTIIVRLFSLRTVPALTSLVHRSYKTKRRRVTCTIPSLTVFLTLLYPQLARAQLKVSDDAVCLRSLTASLTLPHPQFLAAETEFPIFFYALATALHLAHRKSKKNKKNDKSPKNPSINEIRASVAALAKNGKIDSREFHIACPCTPGRLTL